MADIPRISASHFNHIQLSTVPGHGGDTLVLFRNLEPQPAQGWKWISHLTVLLRITSLCGRWCSASHFKITAGLNPSLSKTHATGCESKGPSQWSLPTTWEAVDSQRFFWAAKPPQYGLTLSSCSFLLSQYPSNRPDINCTGEAVNVKSNPTLWQRTF